MKGSGCAGTADSGDLHLEFPDAPRAPQVGSRPAGDGYARAPHRRADPAGQGDVRRRHRQPRAHAAGRRDRRRGRALTADARFFLSALEGLSDAEAERAVLPFPSHEVDPYRGLAPHFDVASARARALHAVAEGDARLVVASAAALLPRVSAPDRLAGVSITSRPGRTSRRPILATCSRTPASRARTRSTSTASSACAAASSTSSPPARPNRSASSSSATPSNRSGPTIPRRSARRRRSTRWRSCRCRSCSARPTTPTAPPRCSTTSGPAAGRRCSCRSPTRCARRGRSSRRRSPPATTRPSRRGRACRRRRR